MPEVKKIATRESYGNALVELGKKHDDVVVLDADLAGATKTGTFKKAFPERHIDCGIAEADMMGIAAGIATTGKVPFASTFAMFAAGRAFEQVRNSIGYPHLNVKIGATHAGISVGEDGATHQCLEDIALMRMIPGMTVVVPSDDIEAKAAVEAAYEHKGPVYLRFGRLAVPVINDRPDYKFELGKGVLLREGSDVTIVATGLEVGSALEAADMLAKDGVSAEVINIHTVKPLDEEIILKSAAKTGKVVTAEEAFIAGGLGGAVAELLSAKLPTKLARIGVDDQFGESGPAAELLHKYKLDEPQLWKKPRTIFVCSMSDLFGEWVPLDWIKAVFDACEAAPQHRYLFLTKNPNRYIELAEKDMLPRQHWYGYSATRENQLWRFHHADECPCINLFVSIEPILEPMQPRFSTHTPADWVIIGAETGNRKGKVIPEKKWINYILAECEYSGRPIFMKESLRPIMGDDFRQEFPW